DLHMRGRRVEVLDKAPIPKLYRDRPPRAVARLHDDAVDARLEVQWLWRLALLRARVQVHALVDASGFVVVERVVAGDGEQVAGRLLLQDVAAVVGLVDACDERLGGPRVVLGQAKAFRGDPRETGP